VKHFISHSLDQPGRLILNVVGDLLDGGEWTPAILKALSKTKGGIALNRFRFTKEQMEVIVDNSFHLESLGM
jgi:hypothetical protein